MSYVCHVTARQLAEAQHITDIVCIQQVVLAWLLQRSPNILLIPGTSSVAHLRENLAAATLQIPPDAITSLDRIAGSGEIAESRV
jgi:aryl-alcohol dehydrogenase-like predicted oxidoreductase